MNLPLESSISKAISKAIRAHYPGAMVRKRHVTMGTMGDPDLYGCLPGGRHFEIEVKRPGNYPTALQDQRLAEWFTAGAISGVARSVEDALQILAKGEVK